MSADFDQDSVECVFDFTGQTIFGVVGPCKVRFVNEESKKALVYLLKLIGVSFEIQEKDR